jgi:2-polyprenyl-3-methyl-5-hydroxy-6-metoxy-1,4-benzoquinol methylase
MTTHSRAERVARIKDKIRHMGQVYRPGNASQPGHLYSPLPFDDFRDVPVQRGAVEGRFELIRDDLLQFLSRGTLLDLGCHAGYNCFRFHELGFQCTGIDADALTIEIARDTAELEGCPIDFRCAEATPELIDALGDFDVVIFTAVFQWITKARSFETAQEVLRRLLAHCEILYFETSMGAEGKAKMPMLPDVAAVERMLQELGHPQVKLIGALDRSRYLFRTSRASAEQAPVVAELKSALDRCLACQPLYQKRNRYFHSRVWKEQIPGGLDLAVKLVEPLHEAAARLLTREHEFLAALDAPQFPRMIMTGRLGPAYVLISEWIDGQPLNLLKGTLACDFSPAWVRRELETIRRELSAAGIRHRDITERNLVYAPGRLVLLDFGWACWDHETDVFTPEELVQPNDDLAVANLTDRLDAAA